MKERAYGKINLSLDVFHIREDGYHDLRSIMLPIDFYDELEIRIADHDSYLCNRSFLAFDERNSIVKMMKTRRFSSSQPFLSEIPTRSKKML